METMKDAFELQGGIEEISAQIKVLEKQRDGLLERRNEIINRFRDRGIERDGPFFIEVESEGRRTVNLKKLETAFPDAYQACKMVKVSCTIDALSRVLGQEQIDEVCDKSTPKYRIGWDLR